MSDPVIGGVYYVADQALTLPPNDRRELHAERRPVLVISGPKTNSDATWRFVLVAPISSSTSHRTRFCVQLGAGVANLSKKGWVRIPATQPLMKADLEDRTGIVPGPKLEEARARLMDYLGLTDEE